MNEIGNALAAELDRLGATDIRFAHGSKHPRIHFTWNGEEHYRAFAGTPRNAGDAIHETLRDLRHQLGLVKTKKRVGDRRRRRLKPIAAPIRVVDCHVPERPDPMAPLRRHPQFAAAQAWALDQAWRALFIARALGQGYVPVMAGGRAQVTA
ncbi:hypothetical protein [Inquilinus sp. CA228]|uniref:hypothetical protein n=1 Tax=Inquilinus sp. CA228 TaxID=3455609 RepID=UPI003F8D831A